jgi:hypothetical protein
MPRTSLKILAAALVAAIYPASAGPPKVAAVEPAGATLAVGYSISFWGIPFGHTNYDGRFADAGYSAKSHFETSGIVSMFWQSTIDASAIGQLDGHTLAPHEYDSFYRRSAEKKERVKVTFANGDATTLADPPYNMTAYPVTPEQKREAVDPMSAITLILAGVKADASNPCGTVAPVFDGRRRYNIEFTYIKDEPVKLDNGLFNGRAHLCQLHYKQIAGFKPKILKEGAAFPPMFADFADVPGAGAPNGHYVVALKLWSHLSWGTVAGDLTELHVGEGPATKS